MRRGTEVPAQSDLASALDPICGWLVQADSNAPDFAELLTGLADRLVEEGIPLLRVTVGELTLHPEVTARQHLWMRGAGTRSIPRNYETYLSATYLGTPVEAATTRKEAIWCRLDEEASLAEFPVLRELAQAGGTDYLIFPLVFTDGRVTVASFTSDAPAGFTEGQVLRLRNLSPFLSLRLELASERNALRSLLTSYLGPNAAQRVLAGSFRRGSGVSISAAIWTCDMRGFTSRGDLIPANDLVALLNRYFDAVAGPIEENGGEILKFIGDAVLAVFPVGAEGPADPCRRALAAARGALRAIQGLEAGLSIGIGLHVGEVVYGNIGARSRLDFTVIGGPVNVACRVESLCKDLEAPILMTSTFVHSAGIEGALSKGLRSLRGVREAVEVFADQAGVLPPRWG